MPLLILDKHLCLESGPSSFFFPPVLLHILEHINVKNNYIPKYYQAEKNSMEIFVEVFDDHAFEQMYCWPSMSVFYV